jgi:hypothetical protein
MVKHSPTMAAVLTPTERGRWRHEGDSQTMSRFRSVLGRQNCDQGQWADQSDQKPILRTAETLALFQQEGGAQLAKGRSPRSGDGKPSTSRFSSVRGLPQLTDRHALTMRHRNRLGFVQCPACLSHHFSFDLLHDRFRFPVPSPRFTPARGFWQAPPNVPGK